MEGWEAGRYFFLRGLGRAWQGHCLAYGDGEMPSPWNGQYSPGSAETVQAGITLTTKMARCLCFQSIIYSVVVSKSSI
jgi:hypothetical protein